MSSVATKRWPVAGGFLNTSRGSWQASTRLQTAPTQLAGGDAWSRAGASDTVWQPSASNPVRPSYIKTIAQLSYSDEYNEAEQAIKDIVVPTIRQHFPEMDYASSLVLYEDKATVLVGVRDPDSVRPFLQTEYGGLPVLLVSTVTETRTAGVTSDLVNRTLEKAIGASIASSQADLAGTLGLYVRERSTRAICALTAYHVVHTDDLVSCPARCDVEPMKAYLHAKIQPVEDVIAQRQRYPKYASSYQAALAQLKEQLIQLTTPTTPWLGRVMATRFHVPTEADPTYSDCALIAVDGQQLSREFNSYKDGRINWTVTGFIDPSNEEVKRTDLLSMIGRTSGRTKAFKNEKFRMNSRIIEGLL